MSQGSQLVATWLVYFLKLLGYLCVYRRLGNLAKICAALVGSSETRILIRGTHFAAGRQMLRTSVDVSGGRDSFCGETSSMSGFE